MSTPADAELADALEAAGHHDLAEQLRGRDVYADLNQALRDAANRGVIRAEERFGKRFEAGDGEPDPPAAA